MLTSEKSPFSSLRPRAETRYGNLVLAIIYGFMAQVYTALYFRVTVDQGPVGLLSLSNFTAFRPYQYRILVPGIVHVLAKLTHADSYQVGAIYEYAEWVAAFAAFWVFRSYLATFASQNYATLLSFALLPVLLFMHVSCAMYHYPYDTPQIVLFTLGLLALRKQNWALFYAALIVGTFNRESTVLLIGAYMLVNFGNLPLKAFCAHLILQATIYAAIKLTLDHIFVSNPGGITEDHVAYNKALLINLLHFQPIVFGTFMLIVSAVGVFSLGHKHVPQFALKLLWLVPFIILVMLKVGVLDEIRAYNEMVPVVLAPLLLIVLGTFNPDQQENAPDIPGPQAIHLREAA
jgi:hypothetical protein